MLRALPLRFRSLIFGGALVLALLGTGVWYLSSRPAIPASALIARTNGLQVALQVGALVKGQRAIEAWVMDERGRPVALQSVALRFSMPFICTDQIDLSLTPADEGHYLARGAFFGMTGSWFADVVLQDATGTAGQTRLVVPIDTLDVVAPFAADSLPDEAFLGAGQQLYVANCASCHGLAGRGDGPRSSALTPRPSDLTVHMVNGKHTNEQTYLTVSNGRPGTAMPAWGGTLNATELWQITAYIRTFAQPAPATVGAGVPDKTQP